MTEKDIADAILQLNKSRLDCPFLCKTPQDLKDLQDLIAEHSEHKIPIVAKIEMPEALENIDKIVAYCDALMVARGDLGVELPAQGTLVQKN
jgi:pyruvate kinase